MKPEIAAMLKRPVRQTVEAGGQAMSESVLDRMIEMVEEQAKQEAKADIQPVIAALNARVDEANAKALNAETDRARLQVVIEGLQKTIVEMSGEETALTDKARGMESNAIALTAEIARLNTDLAAANARCAELEKRCSDLGEMNAKALAVKPAVVNVPNVPEMMAQIVSRDINGAIKDILIKPKK